MMPFDVRAYIPHLIAAAGIVAVVVGGYYWIRQQGVAAERQAQLEREIEAYRESVQKANIIAENLEAELAVSRDHAKEINERVKSEVVTRIVYRECKLPADGVRILQDSLAGPGTR